ncbi:MAG: methylenetetrahydrofolate reductase [Desulfovibrionaceae bacterium]|nr:methylenetetrahydrofolate reductase [Desulfovibrionaceae bacterium]
MNIAQRIAKRTSPFYSVEFFPPKEAAQQDSFFAEVAKIQAINPLFASVTYGAGGSRQDATLDIVARLKRDMGLETMAHLTCVGASEDRVGRFLDQLQELGVDNVLALRGDPPQDGGIDWEHSPFRHAADLVRFVRRRCPAMGIGVAGYPAPHPESPSFSSDWKYTVEKIRQGADFVVTQMFFDVREYFHFVERLRELGVTIPVIPGILPIQSFESLRRTLSLSGTNIPGKLYIEMEDAHRRGGVEAVREAGFNYAVRQIRDLLDGGAPGIHLYTLNKSAMCLRIAEEVGRL